MNFIKECLSYKQVIKYVISGGVAAVVLFGTLIFFHEWLGFWYIYASTIAFICSLLTSFTMQKFWTFRDVEKSNVQKQFLVFFMVSLVGLILNTTAMYILVEVFEVWYLIAQFITTAGIAFFSFFIYRDLVFN